MAVVQLRDASVLDWMIDSGEDGEMLNYSTLNGSWHWKEGSRRTSTTLALETGRLAPFIHWEQEHWKKSRCGAKTR